MAVSGLLRFGNPLFGVNSKWWDRTSFTQHLFVLKETGYVYYSWVLDLLQIVLCINCRQSLGLLQVIVETAEDHYRMYCRSILG